MVSDYEFKIRLLHYKAQQSNAAVAVAVDDVAEDKERIVFPLLELDFEWGGQEVYSWIIGVS